MPILKKLIKFNPYFRLTAQECLKYKVFDPFRDDIKERILVEMQRRRHKSKGMLNKPDFHPCWNQNNNGDMETHKGAHRKSFSNGYLDLIQDSQETEA